jgi:hypothetical protein
MEVTPSIGTIGRESTSVTEGGEQTETETEELVLILDFGPDTGGGSI